MDYYYDFPCNNYYTFSSSLPPSFTSILLLPPPSLPFFPPSLPPPSLPFFPPSLPHFHSPPPSPFTSILPSLTPSLAYILPSLPPSHSSLPSALPPLLQFFPPSLPPSLPFFPSSLPPLLLPSLLPSLPSLTKTIVYATYILQQMYYIYLCSLCVKSAAHTFHPSSESFSCS